MIPEKETITVEFKSDRGKLNDSILVDAVVAFANTEGGRIFLGVEDDGTVTGLHREHMDPYGQEAMIINKTVPGVAVHSEMTEEQGKKIMIITVPKKNAIRHSNIFARISAIKRGIPIKTGKRPRNDWNMS